MFDLFFRAIELVSARERKILLARFFSKSPATLERLGLELDLTRERVRQLESQVLRNEHVVTAIVGLKEDLHDFRHGFPEGPLAIELSFLAKELLFNASFFQGHTLDFRHVVTKLRLVECVGEFALFPNQQEFLEGIKWPKFQLAIERFPQVKPVCFPEGAKALLITNLLAHDGYQKLGDKFVVRTKSSLEDKLHAYISQTRESVPLDAVATVLGQKYNKSSIRQRVNDDSRLKVTADNRVDLATSSAPEYATLPELISKILIDANGVISLEELQAKILSIREFSRHSVLSYASAFPFSLKSGVVSFSEQPRLRDRNPFLTKRLYRTNKGWLIRHIVTTETIRGSSVVLPMSLTNIFFGSKTGRISFRRSGNGKEYGLDWDGRQPKLQSLRQECSIYDLEPGNQLLIELGDDFAISFAPLTIDTTISGLEGVGQFMGLHAIEATPQRIAQYLGCAEIGAKSIIDALSIRKEMDLLEAFSGTYSKV